MIEQAWRLQRPVFLVALAVMVVFAIWLVVTGSIQEAAYAIYLKHHCLNGPYTQSCLTLAGNYDSTNHFTRVYIGLAVAMPPLLGLVLGAPLVAREIEQGTNRLAWTQSITRTRWLLVKLSVGALSCFALVGAMAPLFEWWTSAVQRGARIQPGNFDISGFVDVTYVFFAFMLGAALGALIRRTGWAFAVGVPIFALVRIGIRQYIRPTLISPVAVNVSPTGAFSTNAWVLNSGFVPLGRSSPAPGKTWQSFTTWISDCNPPPPSERKQCIAQRAFHYVVQLQPTGHFWALQGAESAVFVGAALVLLGVAVLAVRRWRT
jgi:ABC-type transport system involved in multi-copper enzyme maturation permease subunit